MRTKSVKKNAKQYQQPLRVTKFHTSASGYAKVLIFFLFARFYQTINNRPHWYSLLPCLLHYPFPRLFADSPTYRHSLFAESLAPCALAFTAPSVFVLFHIYYSKYGRFPAPVTLNYIVVQSVQYPSLRGAFNAECGGRLWLVSIVRIIRA